MNLLDLLKLLGQNNIQIGLENDQLKVTAAKGAMTKELMQLLKDNKEALLHWAQEKHQQQGLPAITPVSRDQQLPLSFNQQGLWFIYQLAPEAASYNMPMALRLRGTLHLDALSEAMNQLLVRHEIFRTRLVSEHGNVWQSIVPIQAQQAQQAWQAGIEHLDHESQLPDLIRNEALTPFRLENSTLFRTRLWQLASDDYVFMVTLHHIIADAVSIQNLLTDLAALYHAAVHHSGQALPPLPVQYADYAWWQHHVLDQGYLGKQLDYWHRQLNGVPGLLRLPTDKPRPAVQTHRGTVVQQTLSAATARRARDFALQNNYTPFMVFLAAQQLLLGRYAKQDDVCVAVPIAGRHHAGTERLVGFFINTLVMRNRFTDNPSVASFLERTRETVLGAFSNQDAPLDKVIEKLAIERNPAFSPIAQIGFNYLVQGTETQNANPFHIDGLDIELIEQTSSEAKYDMIWGLVDNTQDEKQTLTVSIEFNTDLFDENSIRLYISHYEQLLNNMLDDITLPVMAVALVDNGTLLAELQLDSSQFCQVLPLTPMQRDLYLDTLVDADNRRNYFGWTQIVPGVIDAGRLQQSIDIITAHFSSLRMRIVNSGKDYLDFAYAAILNPQSPDAGIKVRQLDWSAENLDDAALVRQSNELAFSRYNLAQEANIRFYLVKASATRYAIVLTAHHACIDGVSLQAITEYYTRVYAALGRQEFPELPDDHYAGYVAAQVKACDNAASYQFWRQQAELCDALSLNSTPSRTAGVYQSIYFDDTAEHLAAIQQYCAAHNTSPAVYIKALYTLMLQSFCYTDSNFYFTDIIAARPQGHAREVGCYFEQRPTVINASLLGKDSRFPQLLHYLNDYRSLSRGKAISNSLIGRLFNTATPNFLFNFYLTERYLPFMDAMSTTTIIAPEMDNAVSLITVVDGDHLQFNLTYMDHQFDNNRFIDRLLHLSQQILAGTEQLSALSLQLPEELVASKELQLVTYAHSSVIDVITAQAKATPQAIAVKDRHRQLTYAELDEQANRLAQYLATELHVQKGDNVALCLDADTGFMVALLATLKCGACYIPVDPQYPAGRIRHILNDAQARCIIAAHCSAGHIADIDTQKLFVDTASAAISACAATAPQVAIGLDDPLYTIYTSGSTGLPKGATVKQRGELNLLQWYKREFTINGNDRVLIISAIGFDLTQKNLLGPLCAGACVVFPEMEVYDPQLAIRVIAEDAITLINCAPSAFYPLAENAADFTALASLRLVLFGGEPIRMNALLAWLENPACKAQVVNMYGPTECTDISSFYRIAQPQLYLEQPIPIGHANDNVTLFVADSSLRLLPQGLVGELLVGGEGVGLGYRQLPELTAEKFIHHPLAGFVYRTGDLVRQRDDGEYVFIGRIDHQVKLRGLRIELGEIEFALRQLPGVKDSLTMVNDDKLTGYILTGDGKVPDNWRAVLGTYLPDYMMPQGIAALLQWPLSANGKIDRKALPALDGSRQTAFVAPRNDTEEKLAAIWREVLGLNEIGVFDSFFELGGHSLLVVRAVARIRDQFQQDIPLRDVFFTPTIAAIAGLLDSQQGQCLLPAIEPVDRDAFQGRFPLSFAQQRLWFIDQLSPNSAVYNIPFALKITGNLDIPALQQAFADVLQRHDALRTRILSERGTAYQVIDEQPLSGLAVYTVENDEAELLQRATEFLLTPFNLARGPLVRAELLQRHHHNENVLLLCMHHIIADGWSIEILVRDLLALYQARHFDNAAPLPALAVQYADYSVWQRNWLSGDLLQQQIDYWRGQLQGAATLELPTDFPRQAVLSAEGRHHRFDIPAALAQAIKHFCQHQGLTPYMLLLGSFQLLLGKYSNQTDISVGSPIANRPVSELQDMVGLFVNTLVMRSHIDNEHSVEDFLQQVKHTSLSAYQHQDIPFELLVDELQASRELSQTPLFQAMLVLQNLSQQQTLQSFVIGDLQAEALANTDQNATAKFDITLNIVDSGDALSGVLEYRSQLFAANTMVRFCEHYVRLLQTIIAAPQQKLSALSLSTPAEIGQQLSRQRLQQNPAWQAADLQTLHSLIEQQAARTPDTVAVLFRHESVTYAELNTRANILAAHLLDRGVTPGSLVALYQQRSVELVISIFATLKAGAAYVPVDPAYPRQRVDDILDDCQPAIILTQAHLAGAIADLANTFIVDHLQLASDSNHHHNPSVAVTPQHLAYVLYTSGSTGKPKGVMIEHASLCNHMFWMQQEFRFAAHDRILQKTPFVFDASVWEFYAPLLAGATLVIAEPDLHKDPAYLSRIIQQQAVTAVQFVPSMLEAFLHVDGVKNCTSLQKVFCGGEPLPAALVKQFHQTFSNKTLVNLYGPTESTIDASFAICHDGADKVTIGKPVSNVVFYVLDSSRNCLPDGIPGELYIGGCGLARGYLNRDDLTEASFIPDPFSGMAGSRLYKTGDLVRCLSNGEFDYLGRIDQQVKIRGFRIELSEIENRLASIPGIRQAAVLANTDERGNQRLVAYYTTDSTTDTTTGTTTEESPATAFIRETLANALPEYMVPAAFVAMDSLPVTTNGKIDRKALQQREVTFVATGDYVAPRNDIERQLADIWQNLLGASAIGINDNFFELGGHSLLAIRLVSDISHTFDRDISVRLLFEFPTIAGLAETIASANTFAQRLPDITPVSRQEKLPLSLNQQGLYFIYKMAPEAASYNIPIALRLRGDINIDALERAVNILFSRHEILRTAFVDEGEQAFQQIMPAPQWHASIISLEPGADIHELARAESLLPFDLSAAPLLRIKLWRIQENELLVVITLHHIIADATSLETLVNELALVYQATISKQPVPLAPLAVQYADYAWWQEHVLRGEFLDSQLRYWQQQLQGVPALLNLPTDRPRPSQASSAGAVVQSVLQSNTVNNVRQFALQHRLTPFMVLLAAQQLLLGRHARQDDVCIAAPIAGRHHAGTENLIGYFVNALVIRNRFADNPTVDTYFKRVKESVLGAFAHQDAPLDKVLEQTRVQRSSSYNPVVQIGFNYITQSKKLLTLNFDNLAIEAIEQQTTDAKYDMIWAFADTAQGITLNVEYRTALFNESTVLRLIAQYQQLLDNMLADLAAPVLKISLIDDTALAEELGVSGEFEQLLPLTPMQRDLYLDTLINPDNRRNYFGSIHRSGQLLDRQLFADCIQRLTAHHAALRMRIVPADKPWLDIAYAGIIAPDSAQAHLAIEELDWSDFDLNEDSFDEKAKLLCYGNYDLRHQPLIRFYLILDSARRHTIVSAAHHACVDAYALQVLCENGMAIYTALATNNGYTPAPDQFADYARQQFYRCDQHSSQVFWQQQALQTSALASSLGNRKPADHSRYLHYSIKDNESHLAAIRNWCAQHNTSQAFYLKGIYALLLQSYCNADGRFYFTDILAARPKGHLQQVGCYFEQRPQIISPADTFSELLSAMDALRADMGNDKRISNSVQNRLFPAANAQFLFNYYLTDRYLPFMGASSDFRIIAPQMNDAVNLIVMQDGDSLRFNFSYTDNVFEDHRFVERFIFLSQQILAGTEQLSALSLQLPSEKPLAEPVGHVDYNYNSVIAAISAQVQRSPAAIAVTDRHRQLTYVELDEQANRLAQYLATGLHVQKGDNVALCLDADTGFMVALLATLKCGACYIPVDPQYPAGRIRHILNDAQARCIIAAQCSAGHIADIDTQKLFVDTASAAISACPATAPQVAIGLDDPLYTIYTSGSTGLPKGATVKQRGELNLLQWYQREFTINGNDRVLVISAIGFDLTQKNLLGPLCAGACVVFPEMDVYDPQLAISVIAEQAVTLINCAPSAFYPLAENAADFAALASLRLVLFGGEPIRMNALLAWLENPACRAQVVNMYGPTECTDIASYYRIEQPHLFIEQPIPIGHANDNVTLFVADSSLRLLPQGLVGELLVGGEGVGLGYRQLPELTAEKFIHHPLAGFVYRTGDLVRQRDDGEYVFIGRIDHQVKLRGLRIELGEIEFALRQLPGVKDSLAMVNDDKLTGYILTGDGKVPDNWRAVLGTYLPDYMMPQGIAALTQWPLSANGKIDRKALPALDGSRQAAFVAPRNDTEEKLAAIWREVLGLDEIGVFDSFFELGGHSLLVVRAVARIRDQFQQDIPLRDVFFTPTIAAIAGLLDGRQGQCLLPAIEPVDRDAFQGRFPLSFAQQRLWLLEQIQAPSAMYNISLALSLQGAIHTEALAQAVMLLVTRHEALRTRIGETEGTAYQYLAAATDYALTTGVATSGSDLHQQVAGYLLQPFFLLNQPLFKARLLILDGSTDAVLLLNMHHIIADGLSSHILLQDLSALYASTAANTPPQLPPLKAQYIDFTVWQQQWLDDAALQQQVDYWLGQLRHVPLLALPFDHPRSARNSAAGGLHSFTINTATAKKLAALAQQENATLFMVLFAAFTVLLHRYSGQDDIAIGTPVANRPQSALENIIGFFVNTLVLRTAIEPQQSFASLLQAVKATAIDAYAHQDLPFERLLDELDIPRDLSHSPLFQAFFSLQTAAEANMATEVDVAGTRISAYQAADMALNAPAKFELSLGFIANGEQLSGTFEYRSELFEAATIQRMTEHFTLLLDAIVDNIRQPLATLGFISAAEQNLQLQQWNATATACDLDQHILAMFEAQAARTPEAMAVRCGATAFTYAEFNRQANRLAHYLMEDKQLASGAHVVICQQANAGFLVSVYAAIKAGACYIPVDPAYPDERIQYIIGHAQADIVLCDAGQKARFAQLPQCIVVDDISPDLLQKGTDNPMVQIDNNSPLYMIYTSGSTGLPKGVEVIHQGETNLIQWYMQEFGFNSDDRFLIVSAIGFDLTQKNFFAPLCSGGQVVFHGHEHYDPAVIENIIAEQGITVINCAPSALYPLIENPASHARIHSLRLVLLGGEAIRLDITRSWLAATAYRCELVNMYGPTECTDISTIYRIRSEQDIACATIPIGKPIANTVAFILDSNLQLLPTGLVGELYVGGLGVSNGYVNNEALNRQAFISSPFKAGEKIYKTGDLVRYRADGNIEYIGRTDYQVKIRGLRIELGEIESALQTIEGIDQAIVLALRHDDEDRLVAYYSSAMPLEAAAIRATLAKTLPDYMIPGHLLAVAVWPLGLNGKINRKALPEPQWASSTRDDLVTPRTTLENDILLVWQDVLKQQHISINDNFFSIGGHSLKAVQVGARLRKQFTIDLALRDLFDAPTIAELALLIQQRQQQTLVMPAIIKADRTQRLPLSYAQQRLWFLAQMDPHSAAYNMPAAFMIHGELDINALQQAFTAIVGRHEVFRTRFSATNGEPEQIISNDKHFVLQQAQAGSDDELTAMINRFTNTPFDLGNDPLLRATVVNLAGGRHALLLNMHHIISDGWSMPVFIRELGTLYVSYSKGLPDTLPELPLQYADYAAWQRQWLQGDILAQEIDYWRTTLKGVPLLLNMPLDYPRPAVQTTHGALFKTAIDATLAQQLRDVSIQQQSTVFMTCLAAYQVLLHKYTHQDDICVGIPLAGRSVPGIQDLIGFFINALAIRTPMKYNLALNEIIASVKASTLSAYSHDQVPVEMLINELGIERNLSFTPVIQCAFNMMSADDSLLPAGINELLGDIRIEAIAAEAVTAKFEILLSIFDTGDDMHLSVEFNTDIYKASTIETLAGHYIELLQLFAAQGDKRLYEIQLGELALPEGYSKALPLTTMQRDIYLATLAKPETLENSLGFAFTMPFAVDIPLWQGILHEITAQFAILRADLVDNKVPYQDIAYFAVSDNNDVDFDLLDWSTENLTDEQIQARLDALVARPYDLASSARVSHRLIKIGEQHYCATMAAHHMVLDGFAAVLIGTWMTTLYEKRLAGDNTPFQMEDHFAAYITENQQGFDRPETIAFWQQQFATASGLQAKAGSGNSTQLLSLPIPVEHYKALRSYSKQFKITPPLYFKCLFAILIRQYTRAENNFVVTEFQAGRNKLNKDSLGCFYHTNPTVVDIDSLSGSFANLFESAREQQKAIRDHLQISHLKQMQMMPPSGVYFSYNYLMMPHFSTMLGEMLHGTRYTPNAEGAVDLRVQAFGDELCFWLAYNTRLFDDKHLLERLLHISHQLVDGNISHIDELNFTLPHEVTAIRAARPGKLELLPLQVSLQALISRNAVAVVCGDKQLTYGDLENRSNAVAQQLLSRGIKVGDRVGICLGRRVDLLPAILGAVKAGACYIPMDVNYPADRLAYMLEDSAASVLITESCMAGKLPATKALIMDIDTIDLAAAAAIPRVNIGMDDLLYIIYTSGSTGLPKGATVYHRGEANLLAWYTREFGFTANDRTLVMSAIGFDLTQKNLFALLTVGGTIVLPETEHYDVDALLRCIEDNAITTLNCAPSAFYPLVELGGDKAIKQLRSLRTLLFGGEPIQLKRLAPWLAAPDFNCSIVNMYGPTECTDISTFHTLSAQALTGLIDRALNDDVDFPLGKPNTGVALYVLNEQNQPVPNGLPGELCIAGTSVGAGYWNKPELTAKAFIANPFAKGDYDKVLYRSGDLVRLEIEQGEPVLYYIGRKDFQVKLRGLRIELGEIEHALRVLPAIHDTVVMVDNEQLLAFVLTDKAHQRNGIDGWREALLGQLPDYMVPKLLIPVSEWPLTPNGKIDRNALLLLDRPDSATQYVAPRTELEQDIAQLWQEVLGIGKAGVFDNFFEAGGDSLAAVRLVAGLEIRFNTKLPVASLFGAQTIAQLAHIINNQLAHWSPVVPIQPQGDKTPIFAVHALGAMVLSYEPLARALGKDQPFYGIQAYGFEEDQTPYTELNEMLEFYVAAIRQQQPHGPYQIIGHSFGGVLAIEIARKLQGLGETVKFVGLLDTQLPISYADSAIDDALILKTFAEHNFGVVDIPLRAMRLMKPEVMIKTVAERFHGAVTEDFIRSAIAIIRGFQRMMIGFVMPPLDVPVILFRPEEKATSGARGFIASFAISLKRKKLGCDGITDQLTVVDVAGDHHSMLKVREEDELVQTLKKAVDDHHRDQRQ